MPHAVVKEAHVKSVSWLKVLSSKCHVTCGHLESEGCKSLISSLSLLTLSSRLKDVLLLITV